MPFELIAGDEQVGAGVDLIELRLLAERGAEGRRIGAGQFRLTAADGRNLGAVAVEDPLASEIGEKGEDKLHDECGS
ncbi:MAG: hypothetical protein BWX86_02394 [Verrucomicrobia bacterium ADurb.Bin122]|nr:MAG: hypothetical protein BWX86_02394 [Verrucomicrobia bacterium ADurb.Bin122]